MPKTDIVKGKIVLITGGTGSFGKQFTQTVLTRHNPKKVIIFSRDEFKQHEMAKDFPESRYPIRYFLGDIRDKDRLSRAFEGVDYVIHAAALKQVPALEYNPTEAVKTNIVGADNIVDAAIDKSVKKVIALSTDKAVNPVNLYGATKLAAEKIFIAANAYAGEKVKFAVVRYGNVIGSRGSIIPLFLNIKRSSKNEFPITDMRMTRFWITLDEGVDLVLKALEEAEGGEIYVPMAPSMKISDLAKAIDPDRKCKIIGIRPGEKIHESLISEDESHNTKIFKGMYVILPQFAANSLVKDKYRSCSGVPGGFTFRSDKNKKWLTPDKIKKVIGNQE